MILILLDAVSLKNKILTGFFGLLLFIVLTEIILNAAGLFIKRPAVNLSKEKDAYRIICVGDSTTYGIGATNIDEFSYPGQLQQILNKEIPGKKFEVINLGAPGINSSQVLLNIKNHISTYKPDSVIVMAGINDTWNLEDSTMVNFYKGSIFKKSLICLELFLYKSNLFKFFIFEAANRSTPRSSLFKHWHLVTRGFNANVESRDCLINNSPKSVALSKSIGSNVTEITKAAQEAQINIIFMKYQRPGMGHPEAIIYEAYNKLGVPVVDNETVFKEAEQNGLNVFHKDGWHPNNLGYSLIAKNVYNKFVDLNFFKGR